MVTKESSVRQRRRRRGFQNLKIQLDFGVQLVDNNGNAFGSQYLMNDVIDLRSIQTGAGFAVALREGGSFSIWQGSTDFGTISVCMICLFVCFVCL